eukprot:853715-Amphidinium_carterae.1
MLNLSAWSRSLRYNLQVASQAFRSWYSNLFPRHVECMPPTKYRSPPAPHYSQQLLKQSKVNLRKNRVYGKGSNGDIPLNLASFPIVRPQLCGLRHALSG